jgi:hypothetical protein
MVSDDFLSALRNYPSVTINPGAIGNGVLTIISHTKVKFQNRDWRSLFTVNRVQCSASLDLELKDGEWAVTSMNARKVRVGSARTGDLSEAGESKLKDFVTAAVAAFMSTDADIFVPVAEEVELSNRKVWLQHDIDELEVERAGLDEKIAGKRKELRLLLV